MPNQEDYLDRVWIKVINLDPNGSWIQACRADSGGPGFEGLASALQRIEAAKASLEHLGRVFRWVRYEACSAAFRALEQPGLRSGKIKGLYRQLARSKESGGGKAAALPYRLKAGRKAAILPYRLPEGRFLQALWDIISPADNEWGQRPGKELPAAGPFGDVPPALEHLRKRKITAANLEELARWHRYDAVLNTLQLMEEEGFSRVTEIPGLHEILLGLEPSGKEARAGSWPFLS